MHTKNVSPNEQNKRILDFHRNVSWNVMWEKYNYTYFLQGFYTLNNQLPAADAINLYPSDIPFDWRKADSANYKATVAPLLNGRDSIMAAQIIQQFDKIISSSSKRKKALVIMNYRHAFNNSFYLPQQRKNDFTYQDVFTGFIFYLPLETHKLVTGVPGFLDAAYLDEFLRRHELSRIILPHLKHFSNQEIENFKSNPSLFEEWLQKKANTKSEQQYPKIDSLLQARNQWLQY